MTNKRQARPGHPHPPTPSLDPDTHEPVETVEDSVAPPAEPSPAAAPNAAEVDVWKERHLRLAGRFIVEL